LFLTTDLNKKKFLAEKCGKIFIMPSFFSNFYDFKGENSSSNPC
jgi:hypothetical protein